MKYAATFEFSGFGDYWGGNGRRWDDDAGCLFSFYGPKTTMRELVEGWIDDANLGGDLDRKVPFADMTNADLREALFNMLSEEGQKAYHEGDKAGPCEIAAFYAECNEGEDLDDCESPVAIVLLQAVCEHDEILSKCDTCNGEED
jgi:hypothetical protein